MIDWQTVLYPIFENPNVMASNFKEIFGLVLDIPAPLKNGELVMNVGRG